MIRAREEKGRFSLEIWQHTVYRMPRFPREGQTSAGLEPWVNKVQDHAKELGA